VVDPLEGTLVSDAGVAVGRVQEIAPGGIRILFPSEADPPAGIVPGAPVEVAVGGGKGDPVAGQVVWIGSTTDGSSVAGVEARIQWDEEASCRQQQAGTEPVLDLAAVRHRTPRYSTLARALDELFVRGSGESFDGPEGLVFLCRWARALTGAEIAEAWCFGERDRSWRLRAVVSGDSSEIWEDGPTLPSDAIDFLRFREAMRCGGQLFRNDLDPGVPWPAWARTPGARAALLVPVCGREMDLGVLCLFDRHRPFAFGPQSQRDAVILARQAALLLEQSRTLESLRSSEEKFRRIFDEGIDGITLNDEAVGTYLDVNGEFLKLTGYRREEVIGRTPAEIGIWARREHFREALRALRARGSLRNFETEFRMKDGTLRCGLYSAARIEVGGRPCILSFVRDVTALREAERELEKSRQQLAVTEKLSALGRVVAGVAHEIRTPSTYVANHLFLIRHRLEALRAALPELGSEIAQVLQSVEVAVEGIGRIDRLVKELRRFVRQPVSGRAKASLDEVVRGAVELFRTVGQGRIELEVDLAPTPPLPVDREPVQQVVLNLLHNAMEASPSGGRVRIATRAVAGGGEVAVQDWGAGIPPEAESRLFDPFFTTKAEGTGLGLSIARRIVEAHGGSIRYETRLGEGTCFVVFLPAEADPTSKQEAP
jgi:PAS domain S-box-containing protein